MTPLPSNNNTQITHELVKSLVAMALVVSPSTEKEAKTPLFSINDRVTSAELQEGKETMYWVDRF